MSGDLTQRALDFATQAHQGQKRKYTGEPYIVHPMEVAGLVRKVAHDSSMVCAAYLHDVVEDCGVSGDEIHRLFGYDVAVLVLELTDVSKPSDGNRKVRKALDRDHTARSSARAKTIKLADLISNTRSIVQHDPDWARVYMREKARLLPVLVEGNPILYAQATEMLKDYYEGV